MKKVLISLLWSMVALLLVSGTAFAKEPYNTAGFDTVTGSDVLIDLGDTFAEVWLTSDTPFFSTPYYEGLADEMFYADEGFSEYTQDGSLMAYHLNTRYVWVKTKTGFPMTAPSCIRGRGFNRE